MEQKKEAKNQEAEQFIRKFLKEKCGLEKIDDNSLITSKNLKELVKIYTTEKLNEGEFVDAFEGNDSASCNFIFHMANVSDTAYKGLKKMHKKKEVVECLEQVYKSLNEITFPLYHLFGNSAQFLIWLENAHSQIKTYMNAEDLKKLRNEMYILARRAWPNENREELIVRLGSILLVSGENRDYSHASRYEEGIIKKYAQCLFYLKKEMSPGNFMGLRQYVYNWYKYERPIKLAVTSWEAPSQRYLFQKKDTLEKIKEALKKNPLLEGAHEYKSVLRKFLFDLKEKIDHFSFIKISKHINELLKCAKNLMNTKIENLNFEFPASVLKKLRPEMKTPSGEIIKFPVRFTLYLFLVKTQTEISEMSEVVDRVLYFLIKEKKEDFPVYTFSRSDVMQELQAGPIIPNYFNANSVSEDIINHAVVKLIQAMKYYSSFLSLKAEYKSNEFKSPIWYVSAEYLIDRCQKKKLTRKGQESTTIYILKLSLSAISELFCVLKNRSLNKFSKNNDKALVDALRKIEFFSFFVKFHISFLRGWSDNDYTKLSMTSIKCWHVNVVNHFIGCLSCLSAITRALLNIRFPKKQSISVVKMPSEINPTKIKGLNMKEFIYHKSNPNDAALEAENYLKGRSLLDKLVAGEFRQNYPKNAWIEQQKIIQNMVIEYIVSSEPLGENLPSLDKYTLPNIK